MTTSPRFESASIPSLGEQAIIGAAIGSTPGILSLRNSGDAFIAMQRGSSPEATGFTSDQQLLARLFGDHAQPSTSRNIGRGEGHVVQAAMGDPVAAQPAGIQLCAADAPASSPTEIHERLRASTLAHSSDINTSNGAAQYIRAPAESFLRLCTLFQWRGTGVSQHASEWQNIPARRNVSTGLQVDQNRRINVGPSDWEACFNEVQYHRDQLDRKWGNCGEQAASLCHIFHNSIRTDPTLSNLRVRQAYSPHGSGHSWTEVQYPDGTVRIYDSWGAQAGTSRDLTRLRQYYNDPNTAHSPWYGR